MARFRFKIIAGFILTLVIFFILSVYTYYNNKIQRETTASIAHTIEVLYVSQTLLNNLLNAETGQRGYVITGDSTYLRPYYSSLDFINSEVDRLERLTLDNALQQENLKTIRLQISERLRIMADVINQRKAGFEPARKIISAGDGLRKMGDIKSTIESFQTIEQNLLKDRRNIGESKAQAFDTTYFITGSLMVIVIAASFLIVYNNLLVREKIESELKQSAEDIKDLYHNAPCGYFSLNGNGLVTNVNNTLAMWLGYDHAELMPGTAFSNLLAADSGSAFNSTDNKEYREFQDHGAASDLALDMKRKDGSELQVLVNSTAMYDANGNFIHSRSSVFDNTERKRAEEERDNFFNNSLDLLVIMSPDLTFLRWNSMWHIRLGYTDTDLRNRNVLDFIHPEDLDETSALLLEQLSAGMKVTLYEGRFRDKQGKYHWLQWSAVPLTDKAIVYGFARDITEQKQATERAFLLNRELEAFTYSVSHDLRAPLRSITGFAQMLREEYNEKLDEEGLRLIDVITRSSRRMGQLIDDLLDFSRIGRKELTFSNLNMRDLVEDILQEQRAGENGRVVNLKLHELHVARGDVNMLRIVWTNLISNAFKYSRKKPATNIEIGSYAEEDKVCYYIIDQGAGFDMRYMDKLFGVFQRLHKANDFEGTGVGLALVKRIVDRHGGKIWAESEVNEGTKFYFTLPTVHHV